VKIALTSFSVIYIIGFMFIFSMNLAISPVTVGLSLVRALVWPYYVATGKPKGQRY